MTGVEPQPNRHSLWSVFRTWWPLAASWALMGLELPGVSAMIARLPNPEVNLAAYGGVVFALALIIEAPIIMLLAASTALSRDQDSYRRLRRFMLSSGAALTAIHIMLAFTPLFDLVVGRLIGAPAPVIEPARVGLRIMTPWTWAIAYRRFNQGVLIRFGHSGSVGKGTLIRLAFSASFLLAGYRLGYVPGVVVGTMAVISGVLAEAVYVGLRVRPVRVNELPESSSSSQTLTLRAILQFYIPLAMTSLLFLLVQPMVSAAISRMPDPLQSLAAWPVLTGLLFILRSLGVAYNEVVVALADEPVSLPGLRRFTSLLAVFSLSLAFLITLTPLADFWLSDLSALPIPLADLARRGLYLGLPLPVLSVWLSWYQGILTSARRTRPITEAVVIYLVVSGVLLGLGVYWGRYPGLLVGMLAFLASVSAQTFWLWLRSRGERLRLSGLEISPEGEFALQIPVD